jgi:hypothetical protein
MTGPLGGPKGGQAGQGSSGIDELAIRASVGEIL